MKKALEDHKYEVIKAHVLDPAHSGLPPEEQELLNRVLSIAKLLDRYPVQKNAVALHMAKYKDISRSQAYEDCRLAMKLFNTIHHFDYDFWHQWLLNDIARNIERCRKDNDPKSWRVIALEHLNLIRALGEKPQKDLDPKLVESHTFLIPIQINQEIHNFDLNKFLNLPENLRKKVADALITEINDSEAAQIMDT